MAHTGRSGDIASVCIALAYRHVVRLGASWPVLFACLCLHTSQLASASLFGVCLRHFQFSDGRTAECAAAYWHHCVESLLLHGQFSLCTTLSPTVTRWYELHVYAATGLHTGD